MHDNKIHSKDEILANLHPTLDFIEILLFIKEVSDHLKKNSKKVLYLVCK